MPRFKTTAIGLVLLFLVSYALAYLYEKQRIETIQERSISARVSELDRQIKQLSFVPKLLSDDATIVTAALDSSKAQLASDRLKKAQIESGLDFAFLMNPSGITVAASNWDSPLSFIGRDYSFRPYFQTALKGMSSTYFAVGATTGIPGYFIAEPVTRLGDVIGVVVAKMALTAPVDTWQEFEDQTIVLDEYGVIILASQPQILYHPAKPLSDAEIAEIRRERRYPITNSEQQSTDSVIAPYRQYSSRLQSQPWTMMTLLSRWSVHQTAATIAIMCSILASLALLLLRVYHQKNQLVSTQQRLAKELEEQVALRTKELEQAQNALIAESNYAVLGRMSAAINHEINQPLTSLRLNLASLRKLIETPNHNVDDIEDIVVESDRTTKRIGLVVSTLRNFTRGNTVRRETIKTGNLIQEVTATIRSERPLMSKHLSVSVCENPPALKGDNVLLQQALLNLLYNAIDAVIGQKNPVLGLSLSRPQLGASYTSIINQTKDSVAIDPSAWYLKISVTDNGGGVPSEMIPALFAPFHAHKNQQQGLGLGLSIAQQITESHAGVIVHEAISDGSVFSLLLPVILPSHSDQLGRSQ